MHGGGSRLGSGRRLGLADPVLYSSFRCFVVGRYFGKVCATALLEILKFKSFPIYSIYAFELFVFLFFAVP
jgi:hypothetical protein